MDLGRLIPDILANEKRVKPHQVGWLRRPEHDQDGAKAWEMPDGRLVKLTGDFEMPASFWKRLASKD